MNLPSGPPDEMVQVRCPRLGHQINFAYCRSENFGLPCPRIILCWQQRFAVEAWLRPQLTREQWREVFEKAAPHKILSLVELIEQVRRG